MRWLRGRPPAPTLAQGLPKTLLPILPQFHLVSDHGRPPGAVDAYFRFSSQAPPILTLFPHPLLSSDSFPNLTWPKICAVLSVAGPSAVSAWWTEMQGTPPPGSSVSGPPLRGDEGQAAWCLVRRRRWKLRPNGQKTYDQRTGPGGWRGWLGQLCSMHKHVRDAMWLFLLLPRK